MRRGDSRQQGNQVFWMVAAAPMAGWLLFCLGYFWHPMTAAPGSHIRALILSLLPIALVVAARIGFVKQSELRARISRWLEDHTDAIDAIPDARLGIWIAVAAGLGLYGELMIIRLHASFFQLFAYFKNVSLLSCFLGLGIGYALGPKRPLTTPLFLPGLATQVACLHFLRFGTMAPYLQNPISEQLTFGMAQADRIGHIVAVFGFVILVFAMNAVCFVPAGHLVARLMARRQKLASYSWNLVGSLL
ncbi:MAG: hypothetical protein ACREBC_36445, partial [Pyrinomonadaceae bacterium]